MQFIDKWVCKGALEQSVFLRALNVTRERLRQWRRRLGQPNLHNGLIPRAHQILTEERDAILAFHAANSLEGYRRLTYMMMDRGVAFVSPATTYRVLKAAGLIQARARQASKKGQGFKQPNAPHRHWHIDITYIKVKGIFYYLILVLDGYSRFIVSWDLRPTMTEADVEIVIQRGREAFPTARPRIISDRGTQFASRDFREFMRLVGLVHTMTSPYYPQSNGKLERCNKTIRAFLESTYLADFPDALRLIANFVDYYNVERLNSAIGYVAPADKLAGREQAIFEARDRGLQSAAERRRATRAANDQVAA